MPLRRSLILSLFSLSTFAQSPLPEKISYNEHIRPIFSNTCFNCHGPDKHEAKAHLQLHSFEAATNERHYTSKSGKKKIEDPGIIPGKPTESLIWERIISDDEDDVMPPRDFHNSLSKQDKALIKKWIEQGAEYEDHWAYEALDYDISDLSSAHIDKLVLAKLKEKGFTERNKREKKNILIRRLSLDLRGMLPSPAELESFQKDQSPDAWGDLVDQFLASPAYGERLAVHWFDLVRYSSSVGFHGDQELRSTPYRDYVIKAFNNNMPFDQFTREQLAGDLLPKPSQEQIIATAYNRFNKVTKEGGAQAGEYLAKYAADRVSNLSSVWLGSTLECAECHDHKYDEFSAKDFYSMAAFFADIKQEGVYKGGNNNKFAPEMMIFPNKDLEREYKIAEQELAKFAKKKKSNEYKEAAKSFNQLKSQARICVITETQKPRITRIFPRGNWMDTSGEVVQPAVPHFLKQITKEGRATRLDLANWLCSDANPMAARAFINRVWELYFGKGISGHTQDLGSQGEFPINPELLDYLATHFASDWDIKKLIKLIVMSETYRLSTERTEKMKTEDPYNRYLARQSILRLDGEFIRDASLQVSDLLNTKMGGRNVMPYQPDGYYSSMNFNPFRYRSEKGDDQYRKAVYMHFQRTFLHPFLRSFDVPNREISMCSRTASNTPLQALTLLNDPTFVEAAKILGQRLIKEGGQSIDEKLNWLYINALSRKVDEQELETLKEFYQQQLKFFQMSPEQAQALLKIGNKKVDPKLNGAVLAAWTQVARSIMNMHEFIVRR
ncbi:PSD1 and planctomycete cytochrome C domain-containing protein [Lentisphaera profundi]|uniref:PSD1 and planctomycete cytochrome C domain-containing protein n=1 Tax=Lentisphaera profundi TaxID=1658616 RepID=A0ABY7VNU6_9BACT|nr:PSD1 and planctomycete cytochrome C domain-containing protein [Lentisphaera profundi]WDE95811.1 PSD1 and planctomycete cytochrome C domain-containing protein [Lentisphaera profundi]